MIAEFEQHCTCLQLCSIHVPLPIYVPGVVPGSMFCNAEEPFFDTHTQQQGPQLPGISLGPKCSGGCTNLCSGGCANYVPGVVQSQVEVAMTFFLHQTADSRQQTADSRRNGTLYI